MRHKRPLLGYSACPPRPCPTLTLQALARKVAELQAYQATLQELIANQPRLHAKDLMLRYGFSHRTLYRKLKAGKLPRPIKFPGHLWRLADLEAAEQSGSLPRPVSGPN